MKTKIFIAFLLGQTWKKGKKNCSGFTDFEFQIINIVSEEKTIYKIILILILEQDLTCANFVERVSHILALIQGI